MDISVPGDVNIHPKYKMAEAALSLANSMAGQKIYQSIYAYKSRYTMKIEIKIISIFL